MVIAQTIMSRRLAMLPETHSPDPVRRYAAQAEWHEAFREKAILGGMMCNPMMWNPVGMLAIGGYAAGKMTSNFFRLANPGHCPAYARRY